MVLVLPLLHGEGKLVVKILGCADQIDVFLINNAEVDFGLFNYRRIPSLYYTTGCHPVITYNY